MAALSEPGSAAAEFSTLVVVDEQSEIGAARRAAMALGASHGLESDARGRLAIVVTEAATNIVRHGGGGVIVLRTLGTGATAAIEMLALDKGPGLGSVERAMSDGFSTGGTAGMGLGAMKRLSNLFEVHSQRDVGTAVLARVGDAHAGAEKSDPMDDHVGAVCVPLRGESECGDAWRVSVGPRRVSVMVVDGLGHGHGAAGAAAVAVALFGEVGGLPPASALARFDASTRGTRGMALSLVTIDEAARSLDFCGVGNVDARVLPDDVSKAVHLVPQNGIVGHTMPNVRCVSAPWPVGARLVMHSDGVSARWRIDAYPGLVNAHPALMAGVIFRDFARERDDATVVVLADRQAPKARP
jgi:anti-sigma regulatory factor (Ser/Thr protein kinase)